MNFKVSLQFNGFWKNWKPRVIMMHNAWLLTVFFIYFFHLIMLKLLHFCFIYYFFLFFTAFSFVIIPWLNKLKTFFKLFNLKINSKTETVQTNGTIQPVRFILLFSLRSSVDFALLYLQFPKLLSLFVNYYHI